VAQDHNDIYSIVERLRILEEGLTPVTVKHGLNPQQKSVDQLSATFKPKTVAVLTAKQDPKNPLAGKLVGDSVETDKKPVEEDVLEKVKKSLADYLSNVADEIKSDTDLKDKKKDDSDLKKKDKKDRDLVSKELDEDPIEGDNTGDMAPDPVQNPVMPESAPVQTITNECGLWEIHGNEPSGFEIRHGNNAMRSRFKSIDEAVMALEMFAAHKKATDESADYIEEA
jgi:hypothetical protein